MGETAPGRTVAGSHGGQKSEISELKTESAEMRKQFDQLRTRLETLEKK